MGVGVRNVEQAHPYTLLPHLESEAERVRIHLPLHVQYHVYVRHRVDVVLERDPCHVDLLDDFRIDEEVERAEGLLQREKRWLMIVHSFETPSYGHAGMGISSEILVSPT